MRKIYLYIPILVLLLAMSGNFAYSKNAPENFGGRGYVGTLPDLTRGYEPVPEKKISPDIQPAKDFNSESEIKPVPRDNPTFVNIILKSDKTSQYINDLNEFIPMLENIYDLIDNESNVQIFNAKVYFFNKNADFFREKYNNKPEAQFVSYKKLLELSLHAKSVALLRNEAQKYNPYLAYGSSGYIYNPNNISQQLEYLKAEIEQTILLLKEAR
jgi:hypothetical protein